MAISKEQPMRSAEIELVDKVNELDGTLTSEIEERTEADADLQNQLGDGFHDFSVTEIMTAAYEVLSPTEWNETFEDNLPNTLSAEINNRSDADNAINAKIGSAFDAENTVSAKTADLQAQLGSGFDSENTVSAKTADLQAQLGSGFDSENTVSNVVSEFVALVNPAGWIVDFPNQSVDSVVLDIYNNLSVLSDRLIFGRSETAVNIAANATITGTFSYLASQDYQWIVYASPIIVSGDLSDLEITVSNCDNTGFQFSVTNNGANSITTYIGYVAFGI